MSALLALASAGTFGVSDFLGGRATRSASVVSVTLLTNFAGLVIALALMFVLDGEWTAQAFAWGAVAGVGGVLGLVLLYQGLADGPNRLVSPLSAVISAIAPIIAGLLLGERPGTLAILGLIIAPAAIWLVAGGDLKVTEQSRRPLAFGIGAGIGFGTFFVLLAQAPDDAGAVPLVAARIASLLVLMVVASRTRPEVPALPATGLALVAGVIDMTANGFFLWATLDGDLAVVGALTSLFPATTVLLAIAFLGERLDRKQAVGLLLAIATAALLS